jgi:hypothetical protein
MPVKQQTTPEQIAMFGHIASRLRGFLAERKWKVADLNAALGRKRGDANAFSWVNGKGAPGDEMRATLAKLTGISEADLRMRPRPDGAARERLPAAVDRTPRVAPARPLGGDVLGFVVSPDGMARLRLDVTLPLAVATPLLRMLLDAGVVFAVPEQGGDAA